MGTNEKVATGANGSSSWLRLLSVTLVVAAISGILALVVLESAVRLLWPQKPYEEWVAPNARYGHLYKPNGQFKYPFPGSDYVMDLRTNSLGFRDDEPKPAADGEKTIVFLGDSYTVGFALDIESRFDRKLAERCSKNGLKFRFINCGVDGWGNIQAFRYAEDHFDFLKPDIAVFTFCENDPFDDAMFLANEGPTPVETRASRLFLHKHFQLYRLAMNLRWTWQHRNEVQALGRNKKPDGAADPAASISIPEEQWQQTLQRVRDFHAALLQRNPNAVLLVQASSPTSENVRSHLATLDNGKNLFYIDLSGPVGALPVAERRLPHDPHWSAKVQDISANALYDRISRL